MNIKEYLKISSQFFSVFRVLSNIYDGAVLQNYLAILEQLTLGYYARNKVLETIKLVSFESLICTTLCVHACFLRWNITIINEILELL